MTCSIYVNNLNFIILSENKRNAQEKLRITKIDDIIKKFPQMEINITNLSNQVKTLTTENKTLKESLVKLRSDDAEKTGNIIKLNDAIVDLEKRFKVNVLENNTEFEELKTKNTNVDRMNTDLKEQLTKVDNNVQEQGILIKTVRQRVIDGN